VGPRAVLDAVVKRKIPSHRRQSVFSPHTEVPFLALVQKIITEIIQCFSEFCHAFSANVLLIQLFFHVFISIVLPAISSR
jgi:hypothetical protein